LSLIKKIVTIYKAMVVKISLF